MGRSPAMMTKFASITGDAALKVFLDKGADPDLQDHQGETLLHKLASDSSKKERLLGVQTLIEAGADLEIRSTKGDTPLMLAVKKKKLEIVRTLLAHGASVNVKTNRGTPLLHSVISCREGSDILLDLLLANGAEVNIIDTSGRTALHRAFLNHLYVTCIDPIERLLQRGAELNLVDENGTAPLHGMSHWEHKNPVPAIGLVKHYGGDLDIVDNQGMTTLLRAARFGKNPVVMRALLDAGADPAAVDNRGNTLLHCVAMNEKGQPLKQLEEILAYAKDFSPVNKSGLTPLDIALKYGNQDVAKKLLELLK